MQGRLARGGSGGAIRQGNLDGTVVPVGSLEAGKEASIYLSTVEPTYIPGFTLLK